jgi:hypothetical protein
MLIILPDIALRVRVYIQVIRRIARYPLPNPIRAMRAASTQIDPMKLSIAMTMSNDASRRVITVFITPQFYHRMPASIELQTPSGSIAVPVSALI